MRRAYYIATFILCLQLTGIHWVALQCVAWTNMAIQYSQGAGLADGLSKTFDGQHPCPMCRALHHGAKNEKNILLSSNNVKLQVFPPQKFVWIFSSPNMHWALSLESDPYQQRMDQPPVPPPRSSLV